MGVEELTVKKHDTYIEVIFPEWEGGLESVYRMVEDLQLMNQGIVMVVRVGTGLTMVLDGMNAHLNSDRIGEILDAERN